MVEIPIEEAAPKLAELIDKARLGEKVILTQNGHAAAELHPLPQTQEQPAEGRPFGSAKGMIFMSEDFDETPEEFAEYM